MEITLYNRFGDPEAYIDKSKENTIFLWNGEAVAYIEGDCVFSWNGKHIGWFEDDVFFGIDGYKIGATKWSCPMVTGHEPTKGDKRIQAEKVYSEKVPSKKVLKNTYTDENLIKYFSRVK